MSSSYDAQQMVRAPQALPPQASQPVASSAAPDTGGLGAADVIRVLKQRKLLISITFVVLYLMVVATTYLLWRYAPQYTSTAYLRFEPPEEGLTIVERIYPKDYIEQQLNAAANGLSNPDTLLDVLKQEEIKQTEFYQWYGEGQEAQSECLSDLEDMLQVAPLRDSPLIAVSLALRRPGDATLVVNTLVRRYVERSRSSATDQRRLTLNQLIQTRANVEEQLENVRRAIAAVRAERDMPALESERTVLSDVIAMLSNTRAELLAREADINAQLDNIRGVDPRNLPISAEMKLRVESDPELRSYRQQVEQIEVQMRVMRKHMVGEAHRQMKLLRTQREQYLQKEATRRETLLNDLRARQVESLEQERARIRTTLEEVLDQLSERENEQRDLDAAITRLESLQRDEERLGRELEQIAMDVRTAEHQHTVQAQKGRMVIAQLARDANAPSRPQPVLYLGGGLVLCLLAGVGLAFLREFTDQAIRTPLDVARHGQLSVLGSVPLLDDEEADIEELELATRQAPHSLVAEAFRQIRTHLVFSGPAESQHILLVTSPRPEDGKTSFAINLGVTFAQGNQRTLIIDCNFRRPGLRSPYAFPNSDPNGLSNILVGRNQFDDVVSQTDIPNLDVLTSGPMPPNPAELLGSPQMQNVLEAARRNYQRVILDGPPALLMSDALVLAMQVDAVVLVARAGKNTKGALKRAREQLQRTNARVIGAVLNGVQARPGGYFRQQYREFYDYVPEEGALDVGFADGPPEIETRGAPPDSQDDQPR